MSKATRKNNVEFNPFSTSLKEITRARFSKSFFKRYVTTEWRVLDGSRRFWWCSSAVAFYHVVHNWLIDCCGFDENFFKRFLLILCFNLNFYYEHFALFYLKELKTFNHIVINKLRACLFRQAFTGYKIEQETMKF